MTLSARDRSTLYRSLSELIDPEAVEAMLSHFPTREVDEPLTRHHLHAEMAELRAEVHIGFAALRHEMGALEERVDARFATVDARFAAIDARFDHEAERQTGALAAMEGRLVDRMHTEIRRSTQWTLGAIVAANGALAAVLTLAG